MSRAFLHSNQDFAPNQLSREETIIGNCLRLQLTPPSKSTCKACKRKVESRHALRHAHTCPRIRSGHLGARVKEGLRQGIREAFNINVPRTEPSLALFPSSIYYQGPAAKRKTRADLLLCTSTSKFFIDVTIGSTAPGLNSRWTPKSKKNIFTPGFIAQAREKAKRKEYAGFTFHRGSVFIPFAMDIFGALSSSARNFLQELIAHAKKFKTRPNLPRLWTRLSVAIVQSMASGVVSGLHGFPEEVYRRPETEISFVRCGGLRCVPGVHARWLTRRVA